MSAGAERPGPGTGQRPRLSPFVFPSETAFRFGLLVTAVLGSSLYVWNWIQIASVNASDYAAGALACLRLSPVNVGATDPQGFDAATNAFSACLEELNRPSVWWMLAGTGALVLVAIALALAAPLWIVRRRRLEPLSEEDAPAALARLRELAWETGLRSEPRFLWNPLDATATGLAFGHAGRYAVALTGGLVTKQVTDPAAFDAIVRHELAHIRNRDVDTTYFTLAIWYAFLLVAVIPFVFTLLDESGGTIVGLSWRLLALALLVYATRNAVVRSREVYADVRASVVDGPDGALRRVVAALPPRRHGLAGRLRSLHPEPAVRVARLEDTSPLFRLGLIDAFGAGVAATIAYDSVILLISFLMRDPLDIRYVGALTFAPLVIGVVGFAIWRQTFAEVVAGGRVVLPWRLGVALAAGFLVGPELELARAIVGEQTTLLRSVLHGEDVGWALTLVAGLVLLTGWIGGSAVVWLRALGARRPLLAAWVGLLTSAAVLTVSTGAFYALRETEEVLGVSRAGTAAQHAFVSDTVWAGPRAMWQLIMDPQFLVVVQRPFVVPVLALLWVFPLAATLVRGRRRGRNDWAFLDPGGQLPAPGPALDPLRPLAIGAAAGLAFCALALLFRFSVHAWVSPETRASDAFVLSFYVWHVAIGVLTQAVAAGRAAARSRNPSRVVDGLAAAFVAGSLVTLAIVAGPAVGGCIDPLSISSGPCAWTVEAAFTWDVYQQVIAEGAIAALAGALLVVGVRAWRAHRHPAEELQSAHLAG